MNNSSPALRVADGPEGLGKCLYSVGPIRRGEVVLEESPLLVGDAPSDLPPLASFAPLDHAETSVALPDAPCIGGSGWPAESVADTRHMGLVLAFLDAAPDLQRCVLTSMQHKIESATEAPEGAEPGLPNAPAAAVCCTRAALALRARGAPWLEEEWELAEEVKSLQLPELEGGLLEILLRIFTVNAHSFGGRAALFNVATKLMHTCHGALVQYRVDPERNVGVFTAITNIDSGQLLTTSYLSDKHCQCSVPQRRRVLYCQKGFICRCLACADLPDIYRRIDSSLASSDQCIEQCCRKGAHLLRSPHLGGRWQVCIDSDEVAQDVSDTQIAAVLEWEQHLVPKVMRLYAGVIFERPTKMPQAELGLLQHLLQQSEESLGLKHFCTQAALRMQLSQQYYEIFHRQGGGRGSEDQLLQETWTAKMRQCEQYLEECETFLSAAAQRPG